MSDIFREVDEELRQDQFKQLWKKYGWSAVIAVLLIVGGVGGKQAWDAYENRQALDLSNRYNAALQDLATEDTSAALDKLTALGEESGGHALLALFQEARLKAEAGDVAGAVAAYEEIKSRRGADSALGRLASVLSVMLRIGEGDTEALLAELAHLLSEGEPFRPAALELSGTLHLKAGDTAAAREAFAALSEAEEATPAMRARATEVLTALGN